jgi:hypothetical protein
MAWQTDNGFTAIATGKMSASLGVGALGAKQIQELLTDFGDVARR